jgi:acyl-CoA synthetase (AMP-forming)/AMP-acid ligase II
MAAHPLLSSPSGYHKNKKATDETINEERWMMTGTSLSLSIAFFAGLAAHSKRLTTGDVCVRSKTGHFTIVDRTKELIKYKGAFRHPSFSPPLIHSRVLTATTGFQVPPAELEGVLLTCPYVADCAVIGVWSEAQATELPRAYGSSFHSSLPPPPK